MTKTFTVLAEMSVSLETEVEAETLQDAWKIAKDTDGSEFIEVEKAADWHICSVVEKEHE